MAHTAPSGRVNSSDATAQPLWMYPHAEMPTAASVTAQHEVGGLPYDNSGAWMYPGQQQLFEDTPVTVDDLLYGFNGSAWDSFPFLDWDV